MKAPLSIRIIYWLTSFVFWLMLLLGVAVFIANIVLLTDMFTENIQLRIQMPVPIEVVENGTLHVMNSDLTVRIEDAYGKLYLVDTPIFITRVVARIIFVMLMLALYMTWRAKQFITNVKNGLVFEKDNISNLKQIAYGLAGLWILSRIYMVIIYQFFIKYLEFDTITVGGELISNNGMLWAAMLLWALGHIFIKGNEMKQEQALTI